MRVTIINITGMCIYTNHLIENFLTPPLKYPKGRLKNKISNPIKYMFIIYKIK